MKPNVYILKDDNNKFYIGSTINLARRLKQHKQNHTQTTSRMCNPKLVFSQSYNNLSKAREIERRLKKLKRKDYILKIISEQEIKMK